MAKRRNIALLIFSLSTISLCQKAKAQKEEDTKIVIAVNNSENLYTRVKDILIRANFYVKDLSIRDSIITYPTEFNKVYVIGFATIKDNTVTLSGLYGLRKIDEWGYTNTPKNFEKIIYYKGNREWRILKDIALRLGGTITYER